MTAVARVIHDPGVGRKFARYVREISVAVAYVLLLVLLAACHPDFFHGKFFAACVAAAPVLIAAIGMTLVILARHIDISVGSQFAVCAVLAGLMSKAGIPMPAVAGLTILAGAAMGAINGGLVAGLGLPSIVVTLATMVVFRESLRWARQGRFVSDLPGGFQWFGLSQAVGQRALLVEAAVIVAVFAWGLRWLAAGRFVYAVGSDQEAARLAGIRPGRVVFNVFALNGAMVGLAALLNATRFPDVDPNMGLGWELQVIAAVVVGGVAISGGRGTLVGTLIGVALLSTIGPALPFFSVPTQWEKAIQGAIILVAVASDVLTRGGAMMSSLTPPSAYSVGPTSAAGSGRLTIPTRQAVGLAGLVAIEVLFFCAIGSGFLSWNNFFEITRNCAELGIVSFAMTAVILTGGIDLSVGSLMSLSAVLLGKLWHDGRLPVWGAVGVVLLVAVVAGGLNAVLITRLRIPPLIVTLGTYSLFSGLADGLAYARNNPSNFPLSFVSLGNGYLGPLPVQVLLLLVAGVGFWALVHRSTVGRALSAIGFEPEGARYAGIPVTRRVALTYLLSGLCAGLAAVVAVARANTAKADTGSGYELRAITAVVLGGTSIFGGRGTIFGTALGLLAVVIVQNGLLMADRPDWLASHIGGELAGILTGLLLLVSIGMDWRPSARAGATVRGAAAPRANLKDLDMRNSQLAVLCAVILAAALIVTGGNFVLVKSLQPVVAPAARQGTQNKQVTLAMMPKSKGNAYFVACEKGAREAAQERGVRLIWDGPTSTNPAEQSRIVDTWLNRGVDVIAVAVEDRDGMATALAKARQKGIKVVTFDADTKPEARDFFVNQATPQGIGYTLMDNAAKAMGNKGEFAVITASLNASNMNEWLKNIKGRLADKYPEIHLVDVRPCDDQKDKAFEEANTLLNSKPNLKLIMAICSPAVPGSAEAVKQSGRKDVKVMGLGLPNDNKRYIHEGITDDLVLWNTMDLGYLTVLAADDLVNGTLKQGDKEMEGGRIGKIEIRGDNILLGKPFTFTKDNIDQFDF